MKRPETSSDTPESSRPKVKRGRSYWRRRFSDWLGWLCLMLILSLYIFPWLKKKCLGLKSTQNKGNPQ